MFTRSGATWTQQGPKLTGTGDRGQVRRERRAVGGREHRADRRPRTTTTHSRRSGVGVHPLGRHVDAAGPKLTGSDEIGQGVRRERRPVGRREHRPDRRRARTTTASARRGCSRARAAPGRSRARSSPRRRVGDAASARASRSRRREDRARSAAPNDNGGVGAAWVFRRPEPAGLYWANGARQRSRTRDVDGSARRPEPARRERSTSGRAPSTPATSTGPTAAAARSGGRTWTAPARPELHHRRELPDGVAVDGQYVYWANSSTDTIGRANLDGTGVEPELHHRRELADRGRRRRAARLLGERRQRHDRAGEPQRHRRQPELHHRRQPARRRRGRRPTRLLGERRAARSAGRSSTARASTRASSPAPTRPRGVAVDGRTSTGRTAATARSAAAPSTAPAPNQSFVTGASPGTCDGSGAGG